MAMQQQVLDYYSTPGPMTAAGKYSDALAALTTDAGELAHLVQGLLIHEYMAGAYGIKVPAERKSESHLRPAEKMIERILEIDPRDLTTARPPEKRLVGVCDHFTRLLVAMLRTKGIPSRGRYGFGSYFNQGYFEDHSLCEYWDSEEKRWLLVDPQFDEVWLSNLKIDHDPLDVPRDRFLVAGAAWTEYRAGRADPSKFGIFHGDMRGLWFIAGALVRDLAALNKMEMLQWDVWGAMPRPGEVLDDGQLGFFDELAGMTGVPDAGFQELRRRYEGDQKLVVPGVVFNAMLNRPESTLTN